MCVYASAEKFEKTSERHKLMHATKFATHHTTNAPVDHVTTTAAMATTAVSLLFSWLVAEMAHMRTTRAE